MRKHFTFTYGTEKRTVEIEEDLLASPFIVPKPSEAPGKSASEIIQESLETPVGRPKLRETVKGKRVALVISDEFRAGLQETITDVLLGEIAKGGPAHVTVLCATGTHDPAIYAGNTRRWTFEQAKKHGLEIEFVGHDCDDPALVEAGRTARGTVVKMEPSFFRAEVRVIGHEAKHHYMAGYSSMVKSLLPGISSRITVEGNHKLALDDDSRAGQHPLHPDPARRRNPFSEDALDAYRIAMSKTLTGEGKLVDKPAETFLVDMISDRVGKTDEVFFVRSGDPERITPEVLANADKQADFRVKKSKYVVLSPGGPPASTAIYGVQNCFDMALLGAITMGGEALVYGPCNGRPGVEPDVKGIAPDRKSKELFWDYLVKMRDWPLEKCYDEISADFQLYLWKTWRVLRLFKRDKVRIWIHGELPPDILAEGGFEHCADPQAWIDERISRADGQFVAIDNGNKLCITGT